MGEFPDKTVGEYLAVLQEAHAALNAIEKKCLRDRDSAEPLTQEDWDCIVSTYDGIMRSRGKVPMNVGGGC